MLVERGEWDVVEGFVGLPKSGKSTLMMSMALDLVGRVYIIAHDPNRNLPTRLPDGRRVPLVRHESVEALRHALATAPTAAIHASDADPNELLELAKELARLGLRRRGAKEYGVPVLFILDEIVVWEECDTSYLGRNVKDLLARRRPHHVGLWYGTQFPTLCHKRLLALSTKLHLFRMVDRADLKRMSDGGVPESIVSQLSGLREHRSLTCQR